MQVDPITGISKVFLLLLFFSVSSASLSVLFHSKIVLFSQVFLGLFAIFAFFSLVKIINCLANLFPRKMEILFHWVHAMAFELLALILLPIIRFSRLAKSFHQPVGNLGGRPVLLIHGYCNDSSVWSYMKYRLAKEGMGPLYSIDLGFPFHSIRDYAAKVQKKANQIYQETNRSDLVLIGHSMGGLVASFYATELADPHTVTDVVTIGSPLAGTHVAKIGIGPNAKEMWRNSTLLVQLHDKINADSSIRFYHIGTKTDQLVVPSSSALLRKNPSREFFFEDIGHASMLFSPRVSQLIASWLRPSLEAKINDRNDRTI